MKTHFEAVGTILDCNLIDEGQFFVHLLPDDPTVLVELERMVEDYKNEPDLDPASNRYDEKHSDNYIVFEDKVIDGCNIVYQTLNVPALKGGLREINSNDEAIYKRARVLGALHKYKGGNIGVVFTIVESQPEPLTNFELEMLDATHPTEEEEEDFLF